VRVRSSAKLSARDLASPSPRGRLRGPPLQTAQQLGRYHLLDRVAFGGMAEIYRAKTFDSAGHDILVAVKRVLPHLAASEEFIDMLVDESRIAALIRHPNVARVYEFVRIRGEYVMAMEFVDGRDARAVLEKCRAAGRFLEPTMAAYIAMGVAAGLHAAHVAVDARGQALRLVHRDVSPSNALISYTGEIKLCDFGIAKATLSRVQTRIGVIKGKVKYMSPEQALGRKLDHRSDIFSLGAVLYELVTNTPPFLAASELELLMKVRDAVYTPVREARPDCPPELAAIIDKALSRSRSARFQSAGELAAALETFVGSTSRVRAHLGRLVRELFDAEIEEELRRLEAVVLGEQTSDDVGENLIADVLGKDATYSRFTPVGTHQIIDAISSHAAELPRETLGAADDGPTLDIHDAPTLIIDPHRRRRQR
jgi:serine/threonine protein kinase